MKQPISMLVLIVVLAVVLVVLIVFAGQLEKQMSAPTDPTELTGSSVPSTGPTDEPPTQVPTESTPPTLPPTEPPTQPPTEPPTEAPTDPPIDSTGNPSDRIGSLYTRGELMNMDNSYYDGGYGAGATSGGKRPGGPVSDQNKYGQYGGCFVGEDEKVIYLTFDCGYEYTATDENGNQYRVTERILDVLKEKNIKAVFFLTMHYVKTQPDLVQRMVDEGHVLGNHTNNHPVMPAQSIDNMVYEVMSLHDYIKEHYGYTMTVFRPPTGAFSIRSLSLLKSLGYKSVLWSFQYYDYDTAKQPAYDEALKTVTSRHHNGAIYLLHAVSATNAAILGDAIDFFLAEGYELKPFQ